MFFFARASFSIFISMSLSVCGSLRSFSSLFENFLLTSSTILLRPFCSPLIFSFTCSMLLKNWFVSEWYRTVFLIGVKHCGQDIKRTVLSCIWYWTWVSSWDASTMCPQSTNIMNLLSSMENKPKILSVMASTEDFSQIRHFGHSSPQNPGMYLLKKH